MSVRDRLAAMSAGRQRMAVALLLTLAPLVLRQWQAHEGFTETAVIPKGDVPTIGYHGLTYYEDGTRVRMGDRIARQRAEELARNLNSPRKAFCYKPAGRGTDPRRVRRLHGFRRAVRHGQLVLVLDAPQSPAGRYIDACNALLRYRFAADTIAPRSTARRTVDAGAWKRQLEAQSQSVWRLSHRTPLPSPSSSDPSSRAALLIWAVVAHFSNDDKTQASKPCATRSRATQPPRARQAGIAICRGIWRRTDTAMGRRSTSCMTAWSAEPRHRRHYGCRSGAAESQGGTQEDRGQGRGAAVGGAGCRTWRSRRHARRLV